MQQVKKKYRKKSSKELAKLCAQAALDKKAEDLIILDVRKLCSFTDFFVIFSGRSTRHVQGLAEAMETELRSKRLSTSKAEGLSEAPGYCLIIATSWCTSFTLKRESFMI
jgi:ribosome-associated protein